MPSDTASSWLEATNGANVNSVRARVCVIPRGRENHPEGNLLHARGVDHSGKPCKRAGTFIDKPLSAKFYLDESACAVAKVDNGIALKPVAIQKMADISADRVGIDPKIPDRHCFKEPAKRPDVVHQVFRP